MRIFYTLIGRQTVPGVRERVLKYLAPLKGKGIEAEIFYAGRSIVKRLQTVRHFGELFRKAQSTDVVYNYRVLFQFKEWKVLRVAARKILFDFDDALFVRPPFAVPASSSLYRQRRRLQRILTTSDTILVGNDYLADYASSFNRNVFILPTCVDCNYYRVRPTSPPRREIVIGWIGMSVNLYYVQPILEALGEIGRRYPNVVFKIVSDRFLDIPHIRLEQKTWRLEDEIADLHSFDIGIMPLTDHPWSLGKCSFKAIQCMAVGIPVVVSPVGMNRQVVQDGENGFWALSAKEWVDKLSLLIEDTDLRVKFGRNARRAVEARYNSSRALQMLQEIFGTLCPSPKKMPEHSVVRTSDATAKTGVDFPTARPKLSVPKRLCFALRDDDICYFTKVEELEQVYRDFWGRIPISVALVPFQAGISEVRIPEPYCGVDREFPLRDHPALVAFLREKYRTGGIDILLHGYNHKGTERRAEFEIADGLEKKLATARHALQELFGVIPTVFVPPNGKVSAYGMKCVIAQGMNLLGPFSFNPFRGERVWRLETVWNAVRQRMFLESHHDIPYPFVMNFGSHKELDCYYLTPQVSFETLKAGLNKVRQLRGNLCLAYHHWGLLREPSLYRTWRQFLEYVLEQDDVELCTVSALFEVRGKQKP